MEKATWEGAEGLEVAIHCPTAVYQQYPGKMFDGDFGEYLYSSS
jgi:hypothetical protein